MSKLNVDRMRRTVERSQEASWFRARRNRPEGPFFTRTFIPNARLISDSGEIGGIREFSFLAEPAGDASPWDDTTAASWPVGGSMSLMFEQVDPGAMAVAFGQDLSATVTLRKCARPRWHRFRCWLRHPGAGAEYPTCCVCGEDKP